MTDDFLRATPVFGSTSQCDVLLSFPSVYCCSFEFVSGSFRVVAFFTFTSCTILVIWQHAMQTKKDEIADSFDEQPVPAFTCNGIHSREIHVRNQQLTLAGLVSMNDYNLLFCRDHTWLPDN